MLKAEEKKNITIIKKRDHLAKLKQGNSGLKETSLMWSLVVIEVFKNELNG